MKNYYIVKRILSAVLCVILAVSMLPVGAMALELHELDILDDVVAAVETEDSILIKEEAEETAEESVELAEATKEENIEEDEVDGEPEIEEVVEIRSAVVNPLYQDILTEEDILASVSYDAPTLSSGATYTDIYSAADYLRQQMVARTENIVIQYQVELTDYETEASELADDIWEESLVHTGVPTEGDYLRGQLGGWNVTIDAFYTDAAPTTYDMTITYAPVYFTTAAQEAQVTERISALMSGFGFTDSTTEYEKIRDIYARICSSVVYDNAHFNADTAAGDCVDYLPHSCYNALFEGSAVCQGYAVLFYRLALEAGLDARYISGTDGTGNHAWNIVLLEGKYYNLDATWDALATEYAWFLLCEESFGDHFRDTQYSGSFYEQYPMSDEDYVFIPNNIVWDFDEETGILTVSGTGKIESTPWSHLNADVLELIIEDGITGICGNGFENFYNMTAVHLPDSITSIGTWAFNNCSALESITIPAGLTTVSRYSFSGCDSLTAVTIPDAVETMEVDSFAWCKNLETVTIGSGVKYVTGNPFDECISLNQFILSPENTALEVRNGALVGVYPPYVEMAGGDYLICAPMAYDGSFTVPENVVYLCDGCFSGCSFSELIIPEGVLALDSDISRCPNLTELTLPASLTYFDGRFFESDNLMNIWVADGNKYFSSREGYLYDAAGEIFLGYPAGRGDKILYIPEGTKSVATDVLYCRTFPFFLNRSIETLLLPEGLETIGFGAFYAVDSLKTLYIPASVTNILTEDFMPLPLDSETDLTVVVEKDSCAEEHVLTYLDAYANSGTSLTLAYKADAPVISFDLNGGTGSIDCISYEFGDSIGLLPEAQWEEQEFLGWYTKPNGGYLVKEDDLALYDMTLYAHWWGDLMTESGTCGENLTWSYKNGVLTIQGSGDMEDYHHFNTTPWYKYRDNITKLDIQGGITHIGIYAFNDIQKLSTVVIPDTVSSIGFGAFNNCYDLAQIQIPTSVTYIDSYVFGNIHEFILFGESGSYAEEYAQENGYYFHPLGTPLEASGICGENAAWSFLDGVFTVQGTGAMDDYDWPQNIPWRKYRKFINTVIIDDGITMVGTNAFHECINLETVILLDSVITINHFAFWGCSNLREIKLPERLAFIRQGAFSYCTALKTVNLPKTLCTIDFDAFKSCTALTDVRYYGSEEEWNALFSYVGLNDGNECLFPIQFNARPGDVTGDGSVGIFDLVELMKAVTTDGETGILMHNADLNSDGKVDILDIIRLVRYLAGHKVDLF